MARHNVSPTYGRCSNRVVKQTAARAKETADAAAANAMWGLPTLIGSEKQIAWAEAIRHRVTSVLRQVNPHVFSKLDGSFTPVAREELRDAQR